jgi:hypothetical protein
LLLRAFDTNQILAKKGEKRLLSRPLVRENALRSGAMLL